MPIPREHVSEDQRWVKGLARNRFVYSILLKLGGGFAKRKYHFTYEPYQPKSKTYLFLANHNTDFDPIFEVIAMNDYLRYVANDHLFRKGLISKILIWLVNPIPKRKGARSDETIQMIKDNLRLGISVAMHCEGNKSFNGRTGHISPRTGELVKEAEGGLITYRIDGGYLQHPRWAKYRRQGPIHGYVVREYTRDELNQMTVEEINAAINHDLFTDAFAVQRNNPKPYPGKALAEHLENVLYLCPQCKGLGTMYSQGDEFICPCGYRVRFNEYGFFEGEKVIFETILDWDLWQREEYRKLVLSYQGNSTDPITSDGDQLIFQIVQNQVHTLSTSGKITLFSDRIELDIGTKIISLKLTDIYGLAIVKDNRLYISTSQDYYEIKCQKPRSGLKYFAAHRYLTGKEYI